VAVIVDEARGDRLAADVDDGVGRARQFADLDDLAVLDGDIAMERRHARAVDDPAVLDQDVIRHLVSSCSRSVVVAVNYSTWPQHLAPSRRRLLRAARAPGAVASQLRPLALDTPASIANG
jgi:hypothetical protein